MHATRFLKLSLLVFATALVLAAAMPRAAQAVTATLVYITNTAANPVPTSPVPVTTTTVAIANANVNPDPTNFNGIVTFGPYDVSQFSSIRVYGDPAALPTFNWRFNVFAIDDQANEYLLDSMVLTSVGDKVFVTGEYRTPGTKIKVVVSVFCTSSNCPSNLPVNVSIYGRP